MNNNIYKDKNNKWYIQTRLKGNDGKFHTCTIRGFNSKKEADNNYSYAIEKWKREHHFYENNTEFEKAREEFYNYRSRQVRSESLRKEKTQFNTYLNVIFSHNTLKQVFDYERLKIIYSNLLKDEKINDRKKSNIVCAFLEFAKYCYLNKYINEELYQDVKIIFQPIKYSRKKIIDKRVIPQNHLKALLSAIPSNHKDLVMFSLFVFLGARISEFLGICVDSCNLELQKITIDRQLLTNGKIIETLKTNTSYRTIKIPNDLTLLLKEYITNNNLKNNDRLFKTSHTDFKRKLKYYEEKANIPLYSAHEFRHTKCFNLATKCENIADIVYCAKIMGHSQSMFLNTYCNHLDKSLEDKFL